MQILTVREKIWCFVFALKYEGYFIFFVLARYWKENMFFHVQVST